MPIQLRNPSLPCLVYLACRLHVLCRAEFEYQPGDWLLFGAETSGLPPEAHRDVLESGGALVKIPIMDQHVRWALHLGSLSFPSHTRYVVTYTIHAGPYQRI